MSILIKGMEMPKSCHFCELYEAEMYWCAAAKRDIEELDNYENRSSFCPLVPVPPHGRLIDADAYESFKTNYDRIISKTPEELAEWIYQVQDGDAYQKENYLPPLSKSWWLKWLKQEAT